MFQNKAVPACIALLSLLPGCIRQSREIRVPKISSLTHETADYSSTQNGMSLFVRKLSKNDSKHLFEGDVLPTHIVGLQITVENQTDYSYILKEKSLGMGLLDYHDVASTIKRSSFWNFIWGLFAFNSYLGAATIAFTPVVAPTVALGYTVLAVKGLAIGLNVLFGTLFFNMRRARIDHNRQIDANMYRYSFAQDTYLLPQQRLNSLVFVHVSDYEDRFDFRLWNASNGLNDTTFDVEIPERSSGQRYALA